MNDINILGDLFVTGLLILMIVAGRVQRGAFGGLLILIALLGFIASGVDSAIKLFSVEWSILERFYHLFWVAVGVGAAWTLVYGFRFARDRMRERNGS